MIYTFKEIPTLQSKRLVLREATQNDINSIFELRSSQEINKFVGTKRVESKKEAEDFIIVCKNLFLERKRIFWLIEFEKNIIGSVVLHNINLSLNYSEIGYKLKPEFQQKGFMNEALQLVLEFAKTTLKLNSIEAYTHKNNNASITLLKKFNFVFQPKRKCQTFNFNRIYKLEIN
jgi:ribosomal-protein-alanine N-acetyltransferase